MEMWWEKWVKFLFKSNRYSLGGALQDLKQLQKCSGICPGLTKKPRLTQKETMGYVTKFCFVLRGTYCEKTR